MPLVVRGARQVGKTYIIEVFGNEEFKSLVTINFEETPIYERCFEPLDPIAILSQIELISQKKIIPGETLLFLDEIQRCPKALTSLRYFKEKAPELHVIAAGSLLEFAIQDEEFSFPVGRVQFAKLYPLSFEEFLEATGSDALRSALATFDLANPPPPAIHEHLLEKIKQYFIVGGMPAAVVAFLKTGSFLEAKYMQKALWDAFEKDFGKYAKKTQHRYLETVFHAVPRLLGSHVKYSRIDPELPNPARDIKRAIELLRLAGLLHPIQATSGASLPLYSTVKEHIFKLIFLDIGLVWQRMDIDPQDSGCMSGPLAEQFVGQELLAANDPFLNGHLFFWTREEGGSAEVDYLLAHKQRIFPIEVKAGKAGKLKSLYVFMQQKKSPLGIKISQDSLGFEGRVLSVPLYLTAHLPRLTDSPAL